MFNSSSSAIQNAVPGCVHKVFEARAARTPDAIAITEGQRRLTYRELNDQANRLAHQIIRHGARPEHLIGVCLERSMEFVVAILAALKAGAARIATTNSILLSRQTPMRSMEFVVAILAVLKAGAAYLPLDPV